MFVIRADLFASSCCVAVFRVLCGGGAGCDETRMSTQLTFSSSRFVLELHRAARTSRRARPPAHFNLDLSHHVLDVSPRGAPGTVHTARVRSGRVRISTSCRLARICGSAGYRQAI